MGEGAGPRLTLLTRAYCHLCDDMRTALLPVAAHFRASVTERDVDAEPELEQDFGAKVPVLLLGDIPDARELCHFHFDRARVEAALSAR
jgi:hypothetical protein